MKSGKRSAKTAMIVLIAAAVWGAAAAHAAEPLPIGTPSPGWLTWSMNYDPTPPRNSGLEQAEYDALGLTVQRIGVRFRSMPVLSPPADAEISPSFRVFPRVGSASTHQWGPVVTRAVPAATPAGHPLAEWRGAPGKGPVRAELALGIYRPVFSYRNRNCSVRIQINDPWMEGRLIIGDAQGGIYLPLPLIEERDGRRYYQADRDGMVIKILPPGREPWLPVSQERWIEYLISDATRLLEEKRLAYGEGSEERRQRFMKSYPNLQKLNPERAEKELQAFEDRERKLATMAEAIAAGHWDALEAEGDRGTAMVGRARLALQGELAGLSAAERGAPAWGFEANPAMYFGLSRTPKRPSLLMNPGDRNAFPLLAPNPDFFRRDLPAGEIQSITVVNRLWKEFSDPMEGELDWAALKRMVK